MKLKLFIICFLSSLGSAFAQAPSAALGSVSGKVVDKATKEPIGYASVSVKEGDKVVTGAVTQDNGNFNIPNLELKSYTLVVQFIGYKTFSKAFTLTSADKSINFGTIAIESEATQLEGVNIVAERSNIVQKIDRKVVNVGKDLIASGTTASEIMNNIPTVSIDPQTKELSLRGNSNVRVLIDGKPSNIEASQLLQQIPSSSIKQIELITSPSAKYNPEGMSGIINIILHKNTSNGFNGTINAGVTFGITPKTNTALNLNYRVGKVNFYSNYGYNHGINANHGWVNSANPGQENLQNFEFRNLGNSHVLKLGMDYYINDKNTLSIYSNQNIAHTDGYGKTIVDYFDTTNNDTYQHFDNENENKTQTYDLAFKHDFDKKGENIEFQANYSKTKNNENTDYDNTATITNGPISKESTALNLIDGVTNYAQFNIDYVNPLSESLKMELGAESRIQTTESDFISTEDGNEYITPYIFSKDSNYDFTFDRNIHAVYSNFSKQWNSKLSSQLGLRAEYYEIKGDFHRFDYNFQSNLTPQTKTETQDDTVTDEIFTVYPSLFVNYAANEKDSYNFNYSRRVDRPSIGQLSPIREWTTPLMESRGNPTLEPQFTNSVEVNYTRNTKMGSITSGVFYRHITNEISRVVYVDPNDETRKILSYDNFDDNNAYGIESSANLKFTKWWAANVSADAYFKTVKGTVQNAVTFELENAQADVTTFNARMNNTFTATKDLRFQLFGMYRGEDLSLQFERAAMYKVDFGMTYNVLKGMGTFTLRFNDVFDTMHFAFDGNIPYRQYGEFYWENQTVYMGFNYMFGGGKNKALQHKQRDANETQGGGMF
ncbi:putative TonB-dependent outer membrane receptor [Flavobacterium enshiense DK69]|uniref:TonB-dependent receptor n=1 Tax=Flavobacterium enshiense DK69 TaxID=1107311 RepID=V6S759_9FLAO|nr:TonB-dependent receptor [Flavobacterium enshiense]ESU22229.1 putative TonB-dependent outer membrane receptor [Flavobacterium enshiense DK69]KGO97241.1 TonB-dependent receptor [Flavobacterium enshiense DK69]